MYILIAITLLNINDTPFIENLTPFTSLEKCENRLSDIYDEKRKLTANYPVTVEIKNKSGKKYILFKSKSDYTKPEKNTFYKCEKVDNY